MAEVDRNLRITLVHGTWGRGFCPSRKVSDRPRFWFENYSSFWIDLSIELYGIPHEITPLIWSGSNSIFARDETAYALAQTLINEHLENPRATQIVIAHSHGGNIALRAFEYLKKLATPQASTLADTSPLIVTLATPFVEVHPADFGRRPFYIRLAVVLSAILALTFLLLHLNKFVFDSLLDRPSAAIAIASWASCLVAPSFFGGVAGWWWIRRRTAARMGRVEALQNATRLGTQFPAQRLLVVRAIDDEASLALALGRILNYVTAYMIVNLGFAVLLSAGVLKFMSEAGWLPSWADLAAGGIFVLVTGTLGSFLIAARSIHGRELAIAPMECQINTQSAPDASGLSKIVTLVSSQSRKPHRYRSGLRHSIYDHEDCAKVIVSWIRSQP